MPAFVEPMKQDVTASQTQGKPSTESNLSQIASNASYEGQVSPGKFATAADLIAAVAALTQDQLTATIIGAWQSNLVRQWYTGMLLVRMQDEGQPAARWGEQHLDGMTAGTVTKLLKASRWLLSRETEAERDECLTISPFRLYDAIGVAKTDGGKAALDLAKSKRTDGQVRQHVRERQVDQHHDTSRLKTFSVLVTEDTLTEIRRALNAVRHQLGLAQPTDSEAMRMLCVDFLSGFHFQAAQAVYPGLDDVDAAMRERLVHVMTEDVLAGRMRCIEDDCGVWWPLQRNHVPPRSQNIRRPDGEGMYHPDDSDWPGPYTCQQHHALFHATGWKHNTLRLVKHPKNAWFKEKLERMLGGRRLEDL